MCTYVRTVQNCFHFYNYPKILNYSTFLAPDGANILFAVKQAKPAKTGSEGLCI